MRVVDMDNDLFGKFAHIIAETLFVILQDILQRSAREEIMLFQPEHFSLIMPVFRIKNLADRFRQLNLFRCLNKSAFSEAAQVKLLWASRRPHTQRIDDRRVISYHRHIIRNSFNGIIITCHKFLASVDLDFVNMTAKMDFTRIFHHCGFPDIAVFQPAVRHFDLLSVNDLLPEQSVFITDCTSHGRQIQAAQAVQKTGGKTAESAVAKARFRFFLQHVADINAQFIQRFSIFFCGKKIKHIAVHTASHQELYTQIVKVLALLFFPYFTAGDHFLHDLVTHG